MLKANWLHSKIIFYKMNKRLGVVQLGECLPRLHGALGLVPRILPTFEKWEREGQVFKVSQLHRNMHTQGVEGQPGLETLSHK